MKRFLKHENSLSEIAETKKSRQEESVNNSQDGQSIKATQQPNEPESCKKQHDHLKHLLNTFENLRSVLEWSISGEAHELPLDTSLEIDGYGSISLPLEDKQANEFVTHFKKTPAHFEIDKSKIKITNPNWNSAFEKFINRVKKELGTSSELQAELHKVNFYSKNCYYIKAADLPKQSQLFASIVLQVPSSYEGGLINCHNATKTNKFKRTEPSKCFFFVAHYGDVEREMEKIKSGNCLELIYHLYYSDKNLDDLCVSCTNEIKHLNEKLAMTLYHGYAPKCFESNIFNNMRGIDNARWNVLKKINSLLPDEQKMVFYFVHAKMDINYKEKNHVPAYWFFNFKRDFQEFSSFIHEEFRELNRKREIYAVYDENGSKLIQSAPVDRFDFYDLLIDNNKQLNLDDVKRCYWYQIGNSGFSDGHIKLYYNKYFLIILPKKKNNEFLISIDPMIAFKKTNLLYDSNNNINLEMLDIVLESFAKTQTSINGSILLRMLHLVEKSNTIDMCRKFLLKGLNLDQNSLLASPILNLLAQLIHKFSYSELAEDLKPFFCKYANLNMHSALIKNLIQLNSKNDAIELFNQNIHAKLSIYFHKNKQSELSTLFELIISVENSLELNSIWLEIKNVLLSNKDLDELPIILKQISTFLSCEKIKIFKELYENEANRLQSKLSIHELEFTWSMPLAQFAHDKLIEEFLKSEAFSYEYKPKTFNSIHEAREFAREHGGLRATYSTHMTGEGRGKTAYVKITKTDAYFCAKSFQSKRLMDQLYFFKNILINLKE